jgi:hypothetical protein
MHRQLLDLAEFSSQSVWPLWELESGGRRKEVERQSGLGASPIGYWGPRTLHGLRTTTARTALATADAMGICFVTNRAIALDAQPVRTLLWRSENDLVGFERKWADNVRIVELSRQAAA